MEHKYPFVNMNIGETVLVPKEQYANARASADYYWRKRWMKFSWVRTEHGNYRCTRIEPTRGPRKPNPYANKFRTLDVSEHFVVSDKEYAKAQPLSAYYARHLGRVFSWRRWPDGRHACTRLK
jgi:hypothetical protein